MEPDGSSADQSGRGADNDSWKSERRQREGEQPTCAEFRKMEERITDMDVEEAVKKLTQAVNQYKKRLSSEDCSQSSAGRQRFYNWNTTHFYPDVHKLDIGILFRHSNDELNRPHSSRNACEEDEQGYVSTSSSEGDDRKRAQKAFARKKMMLIQPPRSHIDNVGATRNGLGVKIDIDLDSRSNSDEDYRDMWHRSPVRLRRIRRQDGRPLSAEINYDAASKKLYIHTLSKKMDMTSGKNGDRAYESAGPRAAKISRRLSSPGSGGSNHVRRFDRKADKAIGESARKQTNSLKTGSGKSDSPGTSHAKTRERRDFIQKLGKLQGLDFYDETQGRPRTEKTVGKRGDRVDLGSSDLVSSDLVSSDLVSLHSGHLSRSQDDVCYIEPARMEWQVLGELNDNQPKSICAMDRQIAREWKSNGKNAQSNMSHKDGLHQSREQENQPQSKNASGALQSGKSVGWCPRTGSSFENIYDSVGFDTKSWTTAQQEMELNERKRQKVPESHFTSGRTKNTGVASELNFPNIRPSSFHCESKDIAEKLRNNSKRNVDDDKVSAMASPVSQPQSGCRSNATGDQQKPRRLLIDAKSLMEEEKQKFEDYKTQYRRQWSGQENVGDDENLGECVDPYIPPDDYVYILRKIHHTRQDAPAHSQPQKPASSGLRVHHQPESDGLPLTRSDPELSLTFGVKHGRQENQSTGEEVDDEWSAAKQNPIQLPSEIYLDRYEYNRNMVMPKDGRTNEARDDRTSEARDGTTCEARGGRTSEARLGRTSEARDGKTSEARDGRTSEARDGRTSEVTETDSKVSAFQRIIRCSDSHPSDPAAAAATSFDGNQIHSRRPDLIPSPMAISSLLSYPTDTKQNKMKETHSREDPLPLSCRVELGPHPNSPDRVPRSQAGLLHKPPKPRKDEFSTGTVGPKQWMYNTTYEPSTPPPTQGPDGHNIFTKTSPVGCTGDGGHFPAEMNFELQGSSARDVCRLPPPPPPPPPSPPSSTSMNVFRTLPEQYRLSIQEPSSAVTDSLVTKNGILPLYHKESNEGRVKMGPLFPLNPGDNKHAQHYPQPTQTHLTDTALNKPSGDRTDYKNGGQRYDKAMVFSITGFHKPLNDSEEMWSPQSPEEEPPYLCASFDKHPSQDRRDFNVDSSSLPPLNSDSLRQTQWTDAEKRRPFVWNERDKRRPIVDWPDLDNICTVEPEMNVHYQWPFEATFDPREQPAYERKRTGFAGQEAHDDVIDNIFNNGVEQHEIANHEKHGYYLRRPSNSVGSNPSGKPPLNQMDISSSPMNCQVRSSDFSQLKGHLSSESGSPPQVFYAVQIPNRSADGEGKTDEALPYPPRPSSRVPKYNRDPPPPPSHFQGDSLVSVSHNIGDLGNRSNNVDLGIEALQPPPMFPLSKPSNRQSGEFGKLGWPLMPPPPTEEDDRRVKGARSVSQPDVFHPISGNVQLRAVLEKKLSQQRQLLSDEKTKEKQPDASQTPSKATAEYEKHISRNQESYKAKKMTTIDSSALDDDDDLLLLIPSKLNVATSSSSADHPNRCVALRDEIVLPKQKSALELHLASSFVRPSASAGTTPSEDVQRSLKQREPFNIEVDLQPPRTADSPQVFGMSVRLSASQEQLAPQAAGPGDADAEEEIPRISITAIKAKLFGESEEQVITGRQLPIHINHQQSRQQQQQQQPLVKSNANAVKDPPSVKTGSNAKNRNAVEDDDRLVDYVSYKDGLKKKRSKIYDELTDFERTYEGLDFDDDAAAAAGGNNHHIPQKVFPGNEFHTDPANVKRLSITNLKLLTESQEKLVPNPSLEYTKEWILTGKGPESGSKSMEEQRNASTNSGKIHPAENGECLANCPRKVIDDMAYRKYGQGSMLSAKSDPDLPFKAVPVGLLSNPTVEHARHFPVQAPDHYANQLVDKKAVTPMPKELKKVQIETQINSYKMSPPHFHHPGDQSEEASEPHFVSRDGSSTRPIQPPPTPCGTRVSLRQLNRSSSFESSARDTKPETRPLLLPPSGVAKLVELFELSQSAPDLTEAGNLFGDSYTETGNPKAMQKPKKQKTPKDVKLRSENRSRIRLLKVNADSGYVESESDSQSSSGPELQPLTSALTAQETHQMDYNKQDPSSDPPERHEEKKQCLPYKKLSFPGSIQPAFSSCEEVSKKSETPEERMRRLQKLREEWFKKNPEQAEEGTKPMFGFDSRLTKRSTGGDSTQNRNIVTKPCAPVTTAISRKETRSDFESGNFLPSVNPPTHGYGSLTKPGKSLDSLDSHENVGVSWQSQNVGSSHASSSGANRGTNTRTEQTIGLDSVRGPEIQKTTINLSLSTPPALQTKAEQRDSSVLSRVSFPSVQLSNRENHHHQPDQSFDQSSVESPAIKASAEYLDTEDKVKDAEKPSPSGFPKERQDRTFQQTSGRDRTITEMKTEKMKVEPWQFEASKRFERSIDQPLKKTFEYESQEFHHKEQVLTDVDVRITKQHTATRAERVFQVERKHAESPTVASKGRPSAFAPASSSSSFRQLSLIDRLDFSDGEMTDATDVTLDAMVGFNQARPSSPETLDFSDMEMSASAFPSSKHGGDSRVGGGGFYARTTREVVQKNSEGSQKLQTMETITRDAGRNSAVGSKQEPLPTREELLAKAQSEMKLYRKDRDKKTEAVEQAEDRRRSIKELVDSFEVMTMPFMRSRQRSCEVRTEDVEGAMGEKQRQN